MTWKDQGATEPLAQRQQGWCCCERGREERRRWKWRLLIHWHEGNQWKREMAGMCGWGWLWGMLRRGEAEKLVFRELVQGAGERKGLLAVCCDRSNHVHGLHGFVNDPLKHAFCSLQVIPPVLGMTAPFHRHSGKETTPCKSPCKGSDWMHGFSPRNFSPFSLFFLIEKDVCSYFPKATSHL